MVYLSSNHVTTHNKACSKIGDALGSVHIGKTWWSALSIKNKTMTQERIPDRNTSFFLRDPCGKAIYMHSTFISTGVSVRVLCCGLFGGRDKYRWNDPPFENSKRNIGWCHFKQKPVSVSKTVVNPMLVWCHLKQMPAKQMPIVVSHLHHWYTLYKHTHTHVCIYIYMYICR